MNRYRNISPEPSEWKVDEHGKRYREVGGIIEYAPTIHTAHSGTVYLDDLQEINRRRIEREEQQRKQENAARAAADTGRICPFKEGRNQPHTKCEKFCVFYEDTACALASMDIQPTRDTKDVTCIIARKRCGGACAMYNHGCTLIETVKALKGRKD